MLGFMWSLKSWLSVCEYGQFYKFLAQLAEVGLCPSGFEIEKMTKSGERVSASSLC